MTKQNKFSVPKIVKYEDLSKPWYVHFRFNGKQKRIKAGINRFNTYQERLVEAKALCKVVHDELKRGWDPFINKDISQKDEYPIIEALDFALDKKKSVLAKKSYLDYRNCLKYIKNSIILLNIDHLYISEINRYHVKQILEAAQEHYKWSNKSYNKYLGYFKSIVSELVEWEILSLNPAHGIKTRKVEETQGHIPPTDIEQKRIKEKLIASDLNFYRYIQLLYHTGIRPEEALQIKIEDVFLERNIISIPPRITKTLKYRIVPINPHLNKVFSELELDDHPSDFYLFGSFREKGKGNVGKFPDFIPGPTKIRRDTATARWKKLIKDELGIQKNMYSEKHKGADDKILAGIDIDALKELYGHRSKLMTEKYAKIVKEVHRKQIIDRSPEF